MPHLRTPNIATITELREPEKVLERSAGKPVAILQNAAVIAYLVPETALDADESRIATLEEVRASLDRTRAAAQSVLRYLTGK